MSATLPNSVKELLKLLAPGYHYVKVDPSDSASIALTKGLWVGTAGAADIVDASGATCTAFPLFSGYNPIACTKVKLTSLTADDIWAIYE